MATISLQCNDLSEIHSSVYSRLKIARQVEEHTWEKCWHKFGWNPLRNEWVIWQRSECTKREFEKNSFGVDASSRKPMIKVCDENETRKKNDGHLKYFCGEEGVYKARAEYSCHGYQTTSGHRFLIHWRYYLFSKRVNRCHGDGFSSVGARTAPLNSQWLVLRIGGANFLHCWVANSIWLERAESLITKRKLSWRLIYSVYKFQSGATCK